jgi:hypothetical protein
MAKPVLLLQPIARDQMPNRFNTANIAAQFQDIGVTAAMGMNPLTIALQQGTQLSAILNSMESPLAGIAQAFKQIINPVSLMTIGIIALVAAGLQFVDWISVTKTGLNTLASGLDFVADHMTGLLTTLSILTAAFVVFNIRTIASTIVSYALLGASAIAAGMSMAAGWIIALGPVGMIIAAIGVIVAALLIFSEDFRKVFMDIANAAKQAVNYIIGFFTGAFKVIVELWRNVGREFRGEATVALGDVFSDALNTDYIGDFADKVGAIASSAADRIRDAAKGLGKDDGKKKSGKTEAQRYQEIIDGAQRRIAVLDAERAAIGKSAFETARLKYETDLLNEAQQKNINLTPKMRAELEGLAVDLANADVAAQKAKDAFDFAKDAGKGFFQDMKAGLEEGKSLWESFGNAVKNVLDKILDKMMDAGIDNLLSGLNIGGGGDSKGGGFDFGSIISAVGGFLGFKKGGAFHANDNSVRRFAKGSAFANSVVSKPTMFSFANGTALGEMGEAGPEAIMPLHRGPDGSLGVRVDGIGASNNNVQQSGDTIYNIDARGTDASVVRRLEQAIVTLAGPGVIEQRVENARIRSEIS